MYKENVRFDENLQEFEKGRYFGNPKYGTLQDLSSINILNVGIDTIRQIYRGTIDRLLFNSIGKLAEDGGMMLEKNEVNNSNDLAYRYMTIPCDFKLTKMSKKSGYRYMFQNNEYGVIVLLGSYYAQNDKEYSHLKIELSPHFIAQRNPHQIQKYLDDVASMFLEQPEPVGVVPHLCVDIQGWDIPLYMQEDIITRSKAIKTFTGIGEIKFNGLREVHANYNNAETIMIGKANALQIAIYRKDLEIVKSDKVDYFHELWQDYSMGGFNKEKKVVRFEARFHHSIVKEFERGINQSLSSYLELSEYLNDLWEYAFKTIRYQQNGVLCPIWQLLKEDVRFNSNDIRQGFKRQQKAKNDTTAIGTNIGIFIGNYLSIAARMGRKFKDMQKELQGLSIMQVIREHLFERQQDEGMWFENLKKRYLERCTCSRYSLMV